MPENEIVIRLSAMGDILLTVPTLRALGKNGINVHLVISSRWAELSEFLPAQVHLFSGTGSFMNLANSLRQLKANSVFDLQGKLSTIALRMFLDAPLTRVYQKRTVSEQIFAIRRKYPLRFIDQRPIWQKYAEICGTDVTKDDALLNLSDEYIEMSGKGLLEFGLRKEDFILLHADASKPGKLLPDSLVREFVKRSPAQIALIGTGNRPIDCDFSNLLDLRNRIPLNALPGVMKHAKAVISSDSGPMHLARAVGTPLVALFFQTCPSLGFIPIPADNVMVISENLPCKPCSLHGQNNECPEGTSACRNVNIEKIVSDTYSFLKDFL